MSINEFNFLFASQEERSRLFALLRRVSRLRSRTLFALACDGWPEWPRSRRDRFRIETA